jgi:hypothetical protein
VLRRAAERTRHGRWLIAPAADAHAVTRRYPEGTSISEIDFEIRDGVVRVIDCIPLADDRWEWLLRAVAGSPAELQVLLRYRQTAA